MNALTGRRVLTYGAVVAALLVAAFVFVLAFKSLQIAPSSPTTGTGSAMARECSPTPCADLQGYQLHVTDVVVNGDVVSMELIFLNSSDSTHASPEDLQLVDSKRHASGLVTDSPGCKTWTRHEFNKGAVFGPINVCFRVSSTTPPMTLRWSPDFGIACCQTDIKIS